MTRRKIRIEILRDLFVIAVLLAVFVSMKAGPSSRSWATKTSAYPPPDNATIVRSKFHRAPPQSLCFCDFLRGINNPAVHLAPAEAHRC